MKKRKTQTKAEIGAETGKEKEADLMEREADPMEKADIVDLEITKGKAAAEAETEEEQIIMRKKITS